jgi:AraC-like DNA-binding protein
VRQFARVFKADTGMSFKDWRTLNRVQTALGLLAEGKSVTAVASELSFSSTSAFIAVFRRHVGTTPSRIARPDR